MMTPLHAILATVCLAALIDAGGAEPGQAPDSLPPALAERLILHFPFNQAPEAGRIMDASRHGHHGENHGAAWIPDGRAGGAMRFDGAGAWIRVPDQPGLRPPRFTLAAWVRPDHDLRGTERRVILSRERRGPAPGFDLAWHDGRLGLTFRAEAGPRPAYPAVDFNQPLAARAWRFVAATYDGETARLYLDGAPLAAIPIAQDWPPDARQDIFLGVQAPGDQGHWSGDLDDLMIFDRALSAEEIRTLGR